MLAQCSTPSQISLNSSALSIITCIILEIELFTALNSLAGAVKTLKLTGAPFLFELVAVVNDYAICHSYKPQATVFT